MPEPWFFDVLPYHPSPYLGECLSGYLLRLAEVNGFISFWELATNLFPSFQHCSQAGLLRWEYPVHNWGNISVRTQLSDDEMQRLTVIPWVEKFREAPVVTHLRYLTPGNFLHGVVNPCLRVCPLCLQEEAYLRLMWRLAPVDVCTRHYCFLQGQCYQCGATLSAVGPTHRHLRCAVCNADLRTLPAKSAPSDLVESQQHLQADLKFLLDPDVVLVKGSAENLPQSVGLKFRYLRMQTGKSGTEMAKQMGIGEWAVRDLELGHRIPLLFYLTYLKALSYSLPDFAALEVPNEFVQSLELPHLLHLRLCPDPECRNHQPPPGMGVKLLRDLPDWRRARFRCSACGRRFTCTYEGELTAKPRRAPLPPGRLSRGLKSTEEIAKLVEMGLQGMDNRQIAHELGWGQKTVRLYLEALDLEDQVHQAQEWRRMEERQERCASLRARVETILQVLLNTPEKITIARVAQALGQTAAYLSSYPEVVERIREVSQVHNAQVEKRYYDALLTQIHEIIAEARRENGPLTIRQISERTGLTYQRLTKAYPELHAMVRDAVKDHQAKMKILRTEARCAQINAAAARLVDRGTRLTQAAILREAGLTVCGADSNSVVQALLRKWVSDFAPHD